MLSRVTLVVNHALVKFVLPGNQENSRDNSTVKAAILVYNFYSFIKSILLPELTTFREIAVTNEP